MENTALPKMTFNQEDTETKCCARFDLAPWESQAWRIENKRFAHVVTRSLFHIPINMGKVFGAAMKAINDAQAFDEEYLVLSHDPSAWRTDHYIAINKDVPGLETVRLSGSFVSKTFDGPFRDASKWIRSTEAYAARSGKTPKKTYLFYTTCPKCAKHYGHNPVVALTEV